jgi:ubiquitin carboxyl-terminal hydrolase 1
MVEAEGRGDIGKSVFDGLTANRRSCVECGYTEAVMHFAFDNWQLAVPRLAVRLCFSWFADNPHKDIQQSCQLEDCLADYTRLELLTDCICRKCSMLATHRRLVQEAEKLSEITKVDPNVSASKKKRAREVRRLEARVKAALDEGRIEEDLKGVKMEKVFSKASTKQAMIARVSSAAFVILCAGT